MALKAFFDDSGTHRNSDAVVMGGLIAPDERWAVLEEEWAKVLAETGLRKMHMASCENRRGQFKKLERDERDRIVARFREIIEKLRARMLFSSVSREVWQKVASSIHEGTASWTPLRVTFTIMLSAVLTAL